MSRRGGGIGPLRTVASSSTSGIWSLTDQQQNNINWPRGQVLVDFLVIGGGGGGSAGASGYGGGGGGAGGYRTSFGQSGQNSSAESPMPLFLSTTYTIVVGAGGSFVNGSNSSFDSVVSIGGGAGGIGRGTGTRTGASGGSGGGGGSEALPGVDGGAGTANQGFAGGRSVDWTGDSTIQAGGGGGAGSQGGNGGLTVAGPGGNGISSTITGVAVTRAGGGGGSTFLQTIGTGGTGGGGNGARFTPQINGTSGSVSTGGGGGGGNGGTAGSGGSGVVILRTLATAVSTTGSPTITQDGNFNVYTFTGSGSITF